MSLAQWHPHNGICTTAATCLVGDGGGAGAHYKALWGQIPVGAGPLTGQLHAGALVLLNNLAQPKVLRCSQTMVSTPQG